MQTPIRPIASPAIRKQPSHFRYVARISVVLMAAVTIGARITPARDGQQSSTGPGGTPAGKILWQFNTNG